MMTDRDLEWLALYVAGAEAADKMRADIEARWNARLRTPYTPYMPDRWSHYDREVSRHHNDFDRENYGL